MLAQYETNLIYRRVDENGDMMFGVGAGIAFEEGLKAMGHVLKTRLAAMEDEWWEGDYGALPYMTDILGAYATDENREVIDLMVIERIMDTVGVIGVSEVVSSIKDRRYTFSCNVQTVYGETSVEFGDQEVKI